MLFKVTHSTDLDYSRPISESVMELRMAPLQEFGQHRLSFSLAIGPPAGVSSYFDWLGNTVHFFSMIAPHAAIRIVGTSIVEVTRQEMELQSLKDTWPLPPQPYEMHDFLHFSGPVVDSPSLRELVRAIDPGEGEPLAGLLQRVIRTIDERFTYQPGITSATSPITEMLEHGRGVCQDFTHLTIAVARAIGVPARYVSGFLHATHDADRGAAQTHAWCEIFFPSYGWVGIDPANRCVVGGHFVKVAVGRDYRDVPPNKGVYRGNARETIRVSVITEELQRIPQELAAERIQSLPAPAAARATIPRPEAISQQQQQQQ